MSCRKHPTRALKKVILDALMVVATYIFLTHVMDHSMPHPEHVITFLCVWIPSMYFLRAIDCEHADQLPRVAFWTMASKMFTSLSLP